jgi:DNA-directed RNA polymerase II subunit RPB2
MSEKNNRIENLSWKIIDTYFNDNPYNLVSHHLDSYNNFFNKGIYQIFKENNPFRFLEDSKQKQNQNECLMYLGGKEGNKIYFGKPTIYDNTHHFMYPNDARLRNMTYSVSIHYDVDLEFIFYNDAGVKETRSMTLPTKVYLGKFPIMLHSDLCILKGLTTDVRFNMGECKNDLGGYFIIDGKEKVILSQEKFADNMLFIRQYKSNEKYSHSVEIRSVSEDTSKPIRTTSIKIVAPSLTYTNGQIVVDIPNVKKPMPLFVLMRALGIESDKSIIEYCLLDIDKNSTYVDLFIPSIHDANKIFNQHTALEFISTFTKRQTVNAVLDILMNYFLPHIGTTNFLDKAYFVGDMVKQLLRVYTKEIPPTDRDNFKYKRVELSGTLIYDLFREYYLTQKRSIELAMDSMYYGIVKKNVQGETKTSYITANYANSLEDFTHLVVNNSDIFKERVVEDGFKKAFKGNWGSLAYTKRVGIVQDLNRLSWNSFISHLRKLNLEMDPTAKVVGPRLLNNSQYGYIDVLDTPDGGNIGLHKHLSITTAITTNISTNELIQWVKEHVNIKPLQQCLPKYLNIHTKFFINGTWIGVIENPPQLTNEMNINNIEPFRSINLIKLFRRNGVLPSQISISFNYENNIINMYSDGGRLTRPFYYIDNKRPSYANVKSDKFSWKELVSGFHKKPDTFNNNKIYNEFELYKHLDPNDVITTFRQNAAILDYVDVSEEETSLMVVSPEEFNNSTTSSKHKYYTHIEIDPSLTLGVLGNEIIYPEHNPVARNVFSCGQSRQAVSMYHTNYQMRMDKMAVVLNYGQTPLIKSRYLKHVNNEENPYGINAIVAIMSHTGYNVEDAILISQGAVDRGIFRTSYFTMYESHEEEEATSENKVNTTFTNFEVKKVSKIKPGYNYGYLDSHGLVKENTVLNDKIVIIGKVNSTSEQQGVYTDNSVFTKKGQLGYVDKTFMTETTEGKRLAKIRVCEERVPAIGDKMASRAGQKGTIGLVIPEKDMPFTEDGIRPDLIINPHAIPSRMTIGQLIETTFGKACSLYGAFGDCTAFSANGPNDEMYGEMLVNQGFHSSGKQILYNGTNGEQILSNIFIGPTYYMRLKHMVKDKINYRERGPNNALTRQPVQGRANDGGLRIGEMEKDAVIGHGMTAFLTESFLKRADEYYMAVCNKTGMVAIYNPNLNLFISPSADGPLNISESNIDKKMVIDYVSRFGRSFSILRIPYSFKLLIQELQVLNVQMRIITDNNIDQLMNMSYSNNINKLLKTNDSLPDVIKKHIENTNNQKLTRGSDKESLITKNYDDAMKRIEDCLNKMQNNTKPIKEMNIGYLSLEEVRNGPWSFTMIAAQRTLDYIYKNLRHTCYILCINNGVPSLTKLEPPGIPDLYYSEIERAKISTPQLFTPELLKTNTDDLRVMGCVVKSKKEVSEVSTEYIEWFSKFNNLPDGAYIVNLTDAVILRKDGRNPWDEPSDDIVDIPNYLPILSSSGAEGYWDIPIPNYDDINIVLGRKKITNINIPWESKINKAVFRGGITGCGTNSNTNMRIKLAEMNIENKDEYLNVGLVSTTSKNLRFDPIVGLSRFNVNVGPVDFMSKEEQAKYKYIIHIDGNVAAYRLLEWMLLGSLIIKVKGKYNLWLDYLMYEGMHYVSVKEDLSDLIEVIEWCRANDESCKQIAERGRQFAERALSGDYMSHIFYELLWSVNDRILQNPDKVYQEPEQQQQQARPPLIPMSPPMDWPLGKSYFHPKTPEFSPGIEIRQKQQQLQLQPPQQEEQQPMQIGGGEVDFNDEELNKLYNRLTLMQRLELNGLNEEDKMKVLQQLLKIKKNNENILLVQEEKVPDDESKEEDAKEESGTRKLIIEKK